MPGWKREGWRWAIAVAAICVVLLSVGLVLVAEGLGAAANLAGMLLSVVSVIGVVAAWGRPGHCPASQRTVPADERD